MNLSKDLLFDNSKLLHSEPRQGIYKIRQLLSLYFSYTNLERYSGGLLRDRASTKKISHLSTANLPMSQHRREQKIQALEPQLPNPSSYPWLGAGVLAEITIRATRTTSDIPERISSLKAGLAATQVPPDIRRRIDEAIFRAQGSVSHSKKFTTSPTKTPWQTFAKQHQSGQKAILDN